MAPSYGTIICSFLKGIAFLFLVAWTVLFPGNKVNLAFDDLLEEWHQLLPNCIVQGEYTRLVGMVWGLINYQGLYSRGEYAKGEGAWLLLQRIRTQIIGSRYYVHHAVYGELLSGPASTCCFLV